MCNRIICLITVCRVGIYNEGWQILSKTFYGKCLEGGAMFDDI